MSTQTMSRRSGATIMARLIVLLGSLSVVMVAAVANGALGFLCAMGVTLMGAVGVAKALGESIALSFEAILAIAVGCGLLRGVLRYVEQYFNHYIAFRLLAVLRDRTTYLFDESIADNLRIAKQDATMDEMIDACKMASIHELIQSLPDGYDTEVGVLGDALSAGEKQRIGLARAFLRGSQLILLDEPTSNVDSINEGIILKALKAQKHQRSIILVSHRESTMAIADRIYRIKDGCMTEQGVS